MKTTIDLKNLSTPQLRAMRQILAAGVPARAEDDSISQRDQLCHKSPPKGYPKEKSQYGDPACYRYPLNTKARCLAAWRYVHHADNKRILGSKFKSIESKIKRYAKEHYNLDLQVGESEDFDFEQAFLEYYDAETMGERLDPCEIELEPEESDEASTNEVNKKMEDKEKIEALETENTTLKNEKSTLETRVSESATQIETLTGELNSQKEELETLRAYKKEQEEAAERAEKIKNIKAKLEEAGVEADVDAEADYWLNMNDDVLKTTIAKLSEMKSKGTASASIKVPQITTDNSDTVESVREGLKQRKQERENK